MSRAARLTLASLGGTALVGLAATLFLVLQIEPALRYPGHAVLAAGFTVAVVTIGNLLARFMRWHFLLRRFDVRLPTIPSLSAFAGSFAFLPVPLYLGQIVARARLAPTTTEAERAYVILATVWERTFDAWALAVMAALALAPPFSLALLGAAALVVLPAGRRAVLRMALVGARFCSRLVVADAGAFAFDAGIVARAATMEVWGPCALASLAAWGATVLAAAPLARAAGLDAGPLAVAGVAAGAILAGGASLVPLGAGVSGFLLLRGLREIGAGGAAAAVAAAQVTFVFRVATVWLTLGLGALALLLHLRRRGRTAPHDHFDAIDECYDTWLPEAYRAHLVQKKTAPILARLGARGKGARGLDIGCGRGWYVRELQRAGADMVGIDTSAAQLTAAREYLDGRVPLARASVLGVPFRAGTFDFAYIINVLHHLPAAHQRRALEEMGRAVRPGGLVFVHEMSVRNPLFRLYLGYVFPILKGIEEGTEDYLDPRRMDDVPGLRLAAVQHFTFVPDFVPTMLLPMLAGLERRLEAGRLAPYAAHFLAIYERVADGA